MEYTVRNGESISDVVLNETGDLSAWGTFLDLNNFTDWTPRLQPGLVLQTISVLNNPISDYLQSYPLSNYSVDNIDDLLNSIKATLDAVIIKSFPLPIISTQQQYYIVKQGETITDVVFNSTGSLDNWQTILDLNGFSDWTPVLYTGQKVLIDYVALNTNNLVVFNKYPLNNDSGINDLDLQIANLIVNFEDVILYDDDLNIMLFDDDLTPALFN